MQLKLELCERPSAWKPMLFAKLSQCTLLLNEPSHVRQSPTIQSFSIGGSVVYVYQGQPQLPVN